MWYLIVPPIIVVFSLSFLLWYLSRKGSEPAIAEQLSHSRATAQNEPVFFFRFKGFFLRHLEKLAQHSKIVSLRAHNMLHSWSQSLKTRRRTIEQVLENKTIHTPVATEIPKSKPRTFEPISIVPEQKPLSERPMVSELVTRPEVHRKKHQNTVREEALIARIASDPKNFTAYEELGDYYLEIGNIKDAKECYRQVLKLSPVQRMVKIKIRRLEKLLSEQGG